MTKTCEQCGYEFSCNTDDIADCWCMKLTPRVGNEKYEDCVCPKCLNKQKSIT